MEIQQYNKFIKYLSHKTSKTYYNSYLNYDDYVQIGLIAFWKSENKWKKEKGDFGPYVRTAIFYAIVNEAIKSTGIFCASFLDKSLSLKIRKYLNNGKTENDICKLLNISHERLQELKRISMSMREIYVDIEEKGCPIDLLEIKDILSEEEIDFLLTNGTTKSRSTKHRKLKQIKNRLENSFDN